MVLGQRNHEVQALPPQRAQEPLTQGIRLATAHWGLEDPQPQVPHLLIQPLREDAVPVVDQETEAVGVHYIILTGR